ncbi:hypothetical protein [Uliginosibacterium sp. 31-12]|uniref:hypothetical protein n=1 Tax=Uliginosibacterium sp. 31-12 TaxID=3062781 RepID=UPI0026E1FB61|nr:hypothetical protein [Uliginosibacterium sp. 31-12]MDO6385270.1 hypothetical protein [Uliginosibacterium sp. 31-12]
MLEAKRELEQSRETGLPIPAELPQQLLLEDIGTAPELFHCRKPPQYVSKMHSAELAKVITATGAALDPVLIFWTGQGWVCVDGHHRLDAYRAAKWGGREVPVEALGAEVSIDEAITEAVRRNSKASLVLSKGERMAAAWRLVIGTGVSKQGIVRATGVADGTVANMRRVSKQLLTQHPARDLSGTRWEAAQREAKGLAPLERPDIDAAKEARAKAMANKLVRALGKLPYQAMETLADALEMYNAQIPAVLTEYWGGVTENLGELDF